MRSLHNHHDNALLLRTTTALY